MDNPRTQWFYTHNNPEEGDREKLLSLDTVWHVVGYEVGASGTPHLQGGFVLRAKKRMAYLKRAIGLDRIHFEPMRGTPRECRIYCTKDGDFVEIGTCPGDNRKRTRDDVAKEFVECASRNCISEFADRNPGAWYYDGQRLVRNWLSIAPAVVRPGVHVRWLYGLPGVGKSRYAHELYPNAYIKEPRTKWWNGYRLEKEVIIDDFGPNGIDINHLLRWFDRYKCLVEVKGDMVPLYAEKFVVTSNFHPKEVYPESPQIEALLRRVEVTRMSNLAEISGRSVTRS